MCANSNSNQTDLTQTRSPSSFVDATSADDETLREYMQEDLPIRFDWGNRWLKGDEYAHIITRMEAYTKAF
jgi:hypothetical protein